jgi:hypothetical protein
VPWAAVDLSRGGGCPELTQNGFLRTMDDAFVDVISGGQRHPLRVQLLPRRSNIDKLFIPVRENHKRGGVCSCRGQRLICLEVLDALNRRKTVSREQTRWLMF